MIKRFLNLSVIKKTIVLLLTFVLIPSLIMGAIVIGWMNSRQVSSEIALAKQELETTSNKLGNYMDEVQDIARELVNEEVIREILLGHGAISRYTDSNDEFDNVLKYNDYIVKFQLIQNQEVVWQYGVGMGYAFEKDGNRDLVTAIEEDGEYDFWTPTHNMRTLDRGEFTKDCWLNTYYCSVYDSNNEYFLGTLAVHIREEEFRSFYEDGSEDDYSVSWVMNKDGQLMSATDQSFITEGFPEELQVEIDGNTGQREIFYNGTKVMVLWNRCAGMENYLFRMISMDNIRFSWLTYMILVIMVFTLFCLGFLGVYNVFVLKPLRRLSETMENAKELNLKQDIQPMYEDEIGDLTRNFSRMLLRIDELIEHVYVEKIKTQEAEQVALLSQINPHFLYNTLDSIRWSALRNGDCEVGKQLEALSVMLRETLNFGNKYTTIGKEMTIIRKYCYLLQVRFRKEIDIDIQMAEEDEVWQIPKLLIQPLVENAYKHGLENKVGDKKITIKIKRFHEQLLVYVADNGVGCNAKNILEQLACEGESCFALRNVRDRIRLEYGDKGKFLFFSHPGKGTLVKLILNLKQETE